MEEETPIWNYIPLADFAVPSPPVSDAALGGVRHLWKSVQSVFREPTNKAPNEEPEWDRPADDVLKSISPDPNWQETAARLAAAVGDDWFEDRQPTHPVHVFVGPPGCDIAQTLRVLAEKRQLNVQTAPAPEAILDTSASNMPALEATAESSGEILVIPHLEQWYLRHADGLTLVRRLTERLISSRQRVLVGCDSWAWSFLQRSIGIEDTLGEPRTLAPFDAKRLDAWFRATFDLQGHKFLRSDNDELVFPELPNGAKTNSEQLPHEPSMLIGTCAAVARGNPGVALDLWRSCLRVYDTDPRASGCPVDAPQLVLGVVPPSQLTLRESFGKLDQTHRFILHAALLHGGLSLASLVTLLPFSRDEIHGRASALRRASVLEEREDKLRVTLTAYPAVRQDLCTEGFLTDAF